MRSVLAAHRTGASLDTDGALPIPYVEGVRHSYHQAGSVRLHVAEAGDGPPLVLLHGWPQHWYEWRDVIPGLAGHYRVLCPDLRGFGWSEAPSHGYDRETMARDIVALLDELEIDRCLLAGHDWGGWIGFLICLFAPERVEKFLALNIALPFAPPSLRSSIDLWRLWYQWPLAAPILGPRVAEWISRHPGPISRWTGAQHAWDPEARRSFLEQLAEPARALASARLYRSFQLVDLPKVISGRYRRIGLKTETLLLHGLGDRIIRPSNFRGVEPYAPHLSIEFVEDCGHFIVDERPELVLSRALSFFGASNGRH
jgi:pimeloyl-ACP methyl ester carboxylesterase